RSLPRSRMRWSGRSLRVARGRRRRSSTRWAYKSSHDMTRFIRSRAAIAAALLGAPLVSIQAQSPAATAPPEGQQSVVIRGGWLFTGTEDRVVRNQGILVVAGRLLAVNRPLTA